MHLSPARFNAQLREMGQNVLWRPSVLCPCRNPLSGAARQDCPHCVGKGVIWSPARPAWTGVSSMRIAKEWAAFGLWESGDVVLSVPGDSPLYAAGENDRVVMVQSSEPFSVVLIARGDGAEKLSFQPQSIARVFWITAPDAGSRIVETSIRSVGADGAIHWGPRVITTDDDLDITDDLGGVLLTDGGFAPAAGQQFSITGRRHQEYFLFKDMPQDRAHFGGLALPRRVVMRRWDLFGR